MTDALTAQYFCDLIGVSTVETTSVKKSNSIEGDIEEFGQKSISTLKRNLLNLDEILRIDTKKLLVNLRGNKPLLLDKMIYTEHHLAKKLKDSSIFEYKPNWTKNIPEQVHKGEVKSDKENISENKNIIDWTTF